MRNHRREAARRVPPLLAIAGCCAALVLCSCEGKEELAAKMENRAEKQKQEEAAREQRPGAVRLLIVGKWNRPGETIEFMSVGRMIVVSLDKLGRVKTVFLTYTIGREGEITIREFKAGGLVYTTKGDIRISGDTLNLKMWDEARAKVYSRVHKGVMGKR